MVCYVSAKLYLTTNSGPLDYDYTQPMTRDCLWGYQSCLSIHLLTNSAVKVNFNKNSYTVAESDGQVSVSLRIDGQFFVPVWAVVEVREGTATGGLSMSLSAQASMS